ncbi:MAG TPA: glycerophosphoryl diester phosphodiesterase membrane domain-containing protein, partial [Glaciihabitans sp.]|nr:glycerophosphoryl diester phosphodiesterase membrane domain-containing protein [Glaciihabitans sp.]
MSLLFTSLRHLKALPARYIAAVLIIHAALVLGLGFVVHEMLDAAIVLAGESALTDSNATELFSSPGPVALVVGVAIIAVAAALFYATVLFTIADLQLAGAEPSLRTVASRVRVTFRTLVSPATVLLALVLVVVAPLTGFGLFSPLTAELALPPFIQREFVKTMPGAVGWSLVALVLVYITFRTVLALPLSVVAGTRPGRSLRTSITATGRGALTFGLVLVLTAGGIWGLSRLATEIFGRLVDVAAPALGDTEVAISAASLALTLWALLGSLLFALILVGHARSVAGVGSRPAPVHVALSRSSRRTGQVWRPVVVAAAAVTVLSVAGTHFAPASAANTSAPSVTNDAIVVGHRGYISGGVENTIGALNAAAELSPEVVEVDVLQTGDGGFVTSHDSNLLILAGINANIFDLTTEQVTSTAVRMQGHSDTIPTLTEYAARAAELGIPLMIEFKVHGHETPDFVEKALTELDDRGLMRGNSYHSSDQSVVAEIQRLHPDLRVGL